MSKYDWREAERELPGLRWNHASKRYESGEVIIYEGEQHFARLMLGEAGEGLWFTRHDDALELGQVRYWRHLSDAPEPELSF